MNLTPTPDPAVALRNLLHDRYSATTAPWPRRARAADPAPHISVPAPRTSEWPDLDALLWNTVYPSWIALDNPYPAHAHVPSPRARFRNTIFIGPGSGRSQWSRLSLAHGALHPLGDPPIGGAHDDGITLALVLDPEGLASVYGDFALVLCFLEAGHLAGQMTTWAAAHGWTATLTCGGGVGGSTSGRGLELLRLRLDQGSSHAGARWPSSDPPSDAHWPEERAATSADSFVSAFLSGATRTVDLTAIASLASTPSRRRAASAHLRTSAQSREPMSFTSTPLAPRVVGDLLAVADTALSLSRLGRLEVVLLLQDGPGQWSIRSSTGKGRSVSSELIERLTVREGRTLSTASWIMVVCWVESNPLRLPAGLFPALIGAGLIAQIAALEAARHGQAAGLLRDLREDEFAPLLPPKAIPVHLIAGGVSTLSAAAVHHRG